MTRAHRLYTTISYTLLILGMGIVLVPFIYMASVSFKPQTLVFELPPRFIPDPATLDNYRTALQSESFDRYFFNSLFVAVSTTMITVLLASMMAYAFGRMEFFGKRILFAVLLLGMMIPSVMLIIPQYLVARDFKLLNLQGLIPVYAAMSLSMQTYLLTGFFKSIPKELTEAALIDGANQWTIFWRIILPLSRPGLAVTVIFTFLYSWDEFPWAHVAIKESSQRTLPIGIALFQTQHLTQWGQVFAASIVALIPVVVVYIIFQRYFVAGIATTGIKS
ncbi:MAG TPA: carbohydrate ABC transporter permease [Aggregatilinea sp.]|jgi:multiple sugar transport system permease protein|uniref:carbohydrate ABC transporter permease n=1 Tax=Aggregatilinea sp. TaxID=2806333 RepID=UPI002BE813C9|nr:carbohydrate ABC transporter permease [Aggregatilinea sp.]HML20244.1 carbohydrate ABC transporter permease [Aggregatilinea sp.]